jgi:hypothetical protein
LHPIAHRGIKPHKWLNRCRTIFIFKFEVCSNLILNLKAFNLYEQTTIVCSIHGIDIAIFIYCPFVVFSRKILQIRYLMLFTWLEELVWELNEMRCIVVLCFDSCQIYQPVTKEIMNRYVYSILPMPSSTSILTCPLYNQRGEYWQFLIIPVHQYFSFALFFCSGNFHLILYQSIT